MKFVILKEKLLEGINIIERIPTKSLSLPILNNILIKTEKNFLNLSATDLEVGVNWWSLVKVEEEGGITIPTRTLSNFINFLPNKPLNIELKDSSLEVNCENYRGRFKGTSPEDFPIIPQIKNQESITVDSYSFCQGLNQVVDIAIPSTAKPEISGVYFLLEKDQMKLVATDSFRLGEKTIFLGKPIEKGCSFILPQKAAKEIINIFGEKKGELKIYFSPNQVQFEVPMAETPHPQIQLISRLIEGDYPDYQEIIPKKYKTQIVFQKNELLNQIKAASLFGGKINEVKLKISPAKETVEIFSQSPDLGEYQSLVPGKVKGKEITISFNHKFLAEGLANIKSQEVIFELTDAGGPGALKPVGDPSYLYIVMPIKGS